MTPSSFRQSTIETFLICPLRYKYQYVDGLPDQNSAANLIGQAVHLSMETLARIRRVEGRDLAPDEAALIASTEFGFLVDEDREHHPRPIPWSGSEVIEERAAEAGELAAAMAARAPEWWRLYGEPELIEAHFEDVPLSPRLPWARLEGTIDVATTKGVLLDWKTAKRDWPKSRAHKKVQPLVYSLGYEHLTGNWPAAWNFVIATRATKEVGVHTHSVPLDKAKLLFLETLIEGMHAQTEAGIFPPNPNSDLCSEEWCPFWQMCPASKLAA